MRVKYNMVVDFARPSKSNTVIVSEDDANSRLCHFTLVDDKKPLDMTGVVGATIQAKQGSNIIQSTYGEVTILEDEDGNPINEIEYLIPGEFTKLTGTVTAAIELQFEDAEYIRSFEFYLVVRNALYNEDDLADAEDLESFKEIVRKTQAALSKLDANIQSGALPCVEPFIIEVDGVTYTYYGDKNGKKEINMGYVAYIDQEKPNDEEGDEEDEDIVDVIDESYANTAVKAAETAIEYYQKTEQISGTFELNVSQTSADFEASKSQAQAYANSAREYYENVDRMKPIVSLTKDEDTGVSNLSISSYDSAQNVDIKDGTQIRVDHAYDNGKHTVTMVNDVTGATLTQFDINEPQGSGLGDMLASEFVGDGATKRVHAADNLYTEDGLLSANDLKNSSVRYFDTYAAFEAAAKAGELEEGQRCSIAEGTYKEAGVKTHLADIIGNESSLMNDDVTGAIAMSEYKADVDASLATINSKITNNSTTRYLSTISVSGGTWLSSSLVKKCGIFTTIKATVLLTSGVDFNIKFEEKIGGSEEIIITLYNNFSPSEQAQVKAYINGDILRIPAQTQYAYCMIDTILLL